MSLLKTIPWSNHSYTNSGPSNPFVLFLCPFIRICGLLHLNTYRVKLLMLEIINNTFSRQDVYILILRIFCYSRKIHGSSRSGSMDRSHHYLPVGSEYPIPHHHHSIVQPSQPIMQDPSMPLLNPPNPTTQLEEAKRLLEDESKRLIKSR